ncbi:MAG: hypothetical protein ACKV2Q_10455 [Planctomycetaceae bacterium]
MVATFARTWTARALAGALKKMFNRHAFGVRANVSRYSSIRPRRWRARERQSLFLDPPTPLACAQTSVVIPRSAHAIGMRANVSRYSSIRPRHRRARKRQSLFLDPPTPLA